MPPHRIPSILCSPINQFKGGQWKYLLHPGDWVLFYGTGKIVREIKVYC